MLVAKTLILKTWQEVVLRLIDLCLSGTTHRESCLRFDCITLGGVDSYLSTLCFVVEYHWCSTALSGD